MSTMNPPKRHREREALLVRVGADHVHWTTVLL